MPTPPSPHLPPLPAAAKKKRASTASTASASGPLITSASQLLAHHTPTSAAYRAQRERVVEQRIQHQGALRLLDTITLQSAMALGLVESKITTNRLTADLLRQLDASRATDGAPENDTRLPQWLRAADAQAVRELAQWHLDRGLLDALTDEDPGEPQSTDEAEITFPRPSPQTPDAQLVEYLKCRRSVVYFVDNYCRLEHKVRGVIPFRLWRWQAWLLYHWHSHAKNIALKARQIGVSELVAGYSLWLALFFDTKTILLISKGDDDAQVLLGRAKTMLTHLPVFLFPGFPQHINTKAVSTVLITKDNTETLELVHLDRRGKPHISRIQSLPATQGAGRSRTAALVVLDELAYMLWGAQIWGSVKSTAEGGGKVIGISTANGMGNIFYILWRAATKALADAQTTVTSDVTTGGGAQRAKRAQTDRSSNGFSPVFLSWRRHPERDAAWYEQEKAEAIANDSLDVLHQEYPSEPIEAFIQSGRPVFDQTYLMEHSARIREEMAQRAGENLPPWTERDGLTIFEEPVPGHAYILGADVSEGRGTGDWQDASVVCRQTGREVAALRGHWPLDIYASKIDQLGWQYNTALVAIERNGGGLAAITPLLSGLAHEMWAGTRQPYPKLYHYRPEYVPAQREDSRPGWDTNIRTKPLMVNATARMLREHLYLPRALAFLDEALIFQWGEKPGECGAPKGEHDDMVMSRMITVYLLAQPDAAALALEFIKTWHDRVQARVIEAQSTVPNGAVASAPGGHRRTIALPTPTVIQEQQEQAAS